MPGRRLYLDTRLINVTSRPRKTIEETDNKATYTMKFDRL